MNKLKLTVLTILTLASTAHADDPGVTGNAFLNIGMGARATGMGGAFCAVADDASSNYWNPAGLCGIKRQELSFMHTQWLADIASEYLSFAKPIDEDKSLGVSLIFLHAQDMARNRQAQETGKFSNHDACFSLSYASRMGKLSWGLTPKVIHRQLKDETAASVGLDIGSKYTNDNLFLGAAIQNLGTKIKFISESSPSPLNFKAGIGYKLVTENDSLTFAGDIDKPINNDPSLSLGAEYNYANWVMARVGAKMGQCKQGLSSGLGVVFRDYRLDYAFTSFDDLGLTHRMAITRCFGGVAEVSRGDAEGAEKITEEKPVVSAIQPSALSEEKTVVPDKPKVMSVMTKPVISPTPVKEIARKTTSYEPEPLQLCCVFIFLNTRVFTPDGDGTMDSVSLILRAIIQTQINGWELRIIDRDDHVINVFAASGMPLETLIWDGRNKSGNMSSAGSYFCTLSITDKNGKVWTSSREIIVIE
ncbi:PorV/PorQ family protein [bacterium]|nr:PorV/PorQ family protein [bacterium]MBU1753558.1 PorV/PorQ family protein [bacterium]